MAIILISHRGNIKGKNDYLENYPPYITETLEKYNVEIDLWIKDGEPYLGHDYGEYKIEYEFLTKEGLWIHCKNIEALEFLKDKNNKNNYFWHQTDDVTLTSNGIIWTYPGKDLTKWSVAVLPEYRSFKDIEIAYGICSDNIIEYQKYNKN